MKRSQILRRPPKTGSISLRGKIYVPGLGKSSNKFFSSKPISNIRGPKILYFTAHSQAKMRQYGLSEARVKRVMHTPKRIEEGIAPKTVAMMQRAGSKKHPHEIWVMISEDKTKRKIVSAWRYPGTTKPGESLPEEILREMRFVQ